MQFVYIEVLVVSRDDDIYWI